MKNKLGLITLILLVLSGCTHGAIDKRAVFTESEMVFPKVFQGMTWNYDEEKIPAVLGQITGESSFSNGTKDTYFHLKMKYLGDVSFHSFYRKDNGNIRSITIWTIEPREECAPPYRPDYCRNAKRDKQQSIFEQTRDYFVKAFRKPGIFSKSSGKDTNCESYTYNEIYKWTLENTVVFLYLELGGEAEWYVRILLQPVKLEVKKQE